jgi:hypothetical protein
MKTLKKAITTLTMVLSVVLFAQAQENYNNFEVAVYSRAYETAKMGDNNWILPVWDHPYGR